MLLTTVTTRATTCNKNSTNSSDSDNDHNNVVRISINFKSQDTCNQQ